MTASLSIFRHCKHTILFPYHKIYFVKSFGRKAPPPRGGTVVERRSRKLPESFWASNVEVGSSQNHFGLRTSKSEAPRNVLGLERRSRRLPETFWGTNVEVGGSQKRFGARTSKSEAPRNVLGLEHRSRRLPESFWGSNVEVGGSQEALRELFFTLEAYSHNFEKEIALLGYFFMAIHLLILHQQTSIVGQKNPTCRVRIEACQQRVPSH